jgi:hypothetical protein
MLRACASHFACRSLFIPWIPARRARTHLTLFCAAADVDNIQWISQSERPGAMAFLFALTLMTARATDQATDRPSDQQAMGRPQWDRPSDRPNIRPTDRLTEVLTNIRLRLTEHSTTD